MFTLYTAEIHFDSGCILFSEKHILNTKKLQKKIHLYISLFYVLTHSFMKKMYFVDCAKKKITWGEKAYFSTECCYFLHRPHKVFFSKLLPGHIEHGDVHTTF
jgi:hypothetical protein